MMPETATVVQAYEAEKAKLSRILKERADQGDTGGQEWAYEALKSLERNHQHVKQASAMMDQLRAFRRSQPYGWGG